MKNLSLLQILPFYDIIALIIIFEVLHLFKFNKLPYFNLIPIILISIVLYKLVNNIDIIPSLIGKAVSLFSYFIWGFVIAYFLNPMMVFLEKRLKTTRLISIAIIYSLFLAFTAVLLILIIPEMIRNTNDIVDKLSNILTNLSNYITVYITDNKLFTKFNLNTLFSSNLNSIVSKVNSIIISGFNTAFTQMVNFSSAIFSVMFKFFTGLIISVYLLLDKEKIIKYMKNCFITLLSPERSSSILKLLKEINEVFRQYVIGKTIDSIVVGLICFVGLQLMSVKYSLLISLIIGFTNLIPYIGNIIGLIPTLIITVFTGFAAALKLIVLVLILSTLDGWILAPKIVGKKVGLSPVLILLAISVGGGLFGVIGMFLSIPITAILKTFLDDFVERRTYVKGEMLTNKKV